MAEAGFKEMALTGVHLGSYGRDLRPLSSLPELLTALRDALAPHAETASRPCCSASARSSRWTAASEVVQLVRGSRAASRRTSICRSSTPAIAMLAAMRRPYTLAYYARLVDAIRRDIPHASIGSDIIVGFPGETDDDFEQLTRLSGGVAADAPPRLPVLGPARHRRLAS